MLWSYCICYSVSFIISEIFYNLQCKIFHFQIWVISKEDILFNILFDNIFL